MQQRRPYFSFGLAVLLSVAATSTGAGGSQEPRISSLSTGASQGAVWLTWHDDTRLGFVRGYLAGLHTGYRNGCYWYDNFTRPQEKSRTNPTESALAKCLKSSASFSRTPEYYRGKLTDFYKSFPQDNTLPLDELMRYLSDSENKSLSEIDAAVRKQ